MKREKIISCRLTATEHERLSSRAAKAGRDLSDFLRDCLQAERRPAPFPVRPETWTVGMPVRSTILWLTDGQQDGGTLTVRCS